MTNRKTLLSGLALIAIGCIGTPATAQTETPREPEQTPETPAPSPPATELDRKLKQLEDEKKLLEAQKQVEEARKNLLTERASRATAAFGPLGAYQGAQGTTTLGEANRSVFEATLLAAQAIDGAADQIGDRLSLVVKRREDQGRRPTLAPTVLPAPAQMNLEQLCAEAQEVVLPAATLGGARPIVIVAQQTALSTELVDAFAVSTAAAAGRICAATRSRELEGGSAAAISAGVSAIANLLRTDYSIYGIELTPDQSLLTKGVARHVLASGLANPVYLPDLAPLNLRDARNPAVRRLLVMERLRVSALEGLGPDDARKVPLEQAVTGYDELRTGLITAAEGKPAPIAAIFRQAAVAGLLDQGGYLAQTHIHMLGGTSYTKKNFFTSLAGMPYYVSGGGLTSYQVQEGAGGPILDTVTLHLTSGFQNVGSLHRNFAVGTRR